MSLTLGEKLREAREERGFTIADVAEQTRISSLYLESIENDDYRILPGGIFNKGFVKSYAKFVGIGEAEALNDYSELLSQATGSDDDELKVYRPEVLTDDRSVSSMIPTVIIAAVILGLMTAGILFLVNYMRQPSEAPVANSGTNPANSNTADLTPEVAPSPSGPEMATLKVELKAVGQPVLVTATVDGTKSDVKLAAGSSAPFEPKESLTLNYNRWNAQAVQLMINGKAITLPGIPLNPKDKRIEFTINKENLAKVWTSGAISTEVPAATPAASETAVETPAATAVTPTPAPVASLPTPANASKPTPAPKPTIANMATNTAPKPTPERKPAATPNVQPKPVATSKP